MLQEHRWPKRLLFEIIIAVLERYSTMWVRMDDAWRLVLEHATEITE